MHSPPNLLLVDDEVSVRLAVARRLGEDFNIVHAGSAAAAMQCLEMISDIDILSTDVDMPGTLNGMQLADIVAQRWPRIAIFISSGRDIPEANAPPGSRVISKGSGLAKLVAAICRLAGSPRADASAAA